MSGTFTVKNFKFHHFTPGEIPNYVPFQHLIISGLERWQRACRTPLLPGEAPSRRQMMRLGEVPDA